MHHPSRRPPACPPPQRRIDDKTPSTPATRSREEANRLAFADTIEDPFGHLMAGLAQYLMTDKDES